MIGPTCRVNLMIPKGDALLINYVESLAACNQTSNFFKQSIKAISQTISHVLYSTNEPYKQTTNTASKTFRNCLSMYVFVLQSRKHVSFNNYWFVNLSTLHTLPLCKCNLEEGCVLNHD